MGEHAAGVRIWFVARSRTQVPELQKPPPAQSVLVAQGAHVPVAPPELSAHTPLAQSLGDMQAAPAPPAVGWLMGMLRQNACSDSPGGQASPSPCVHRTPFSTAAAAARIARRSST